MLSETILVPLVCIIYVSDRELVDLQNTEESGLWEGEEAIKD